jgi:hypothetical protein
MWKRVNGRRGALYISLLGRTQSNEERREKRLANAERQHLRARGTEQLLIKISKPAGKDEKKPRTGA